MAVTERPSTRGEPTAQPNLTSRLEDQLGSSDNAPKRGPAEHPSEKAETLFIRNMAALVKLPALVDDLRLEIDRLRSEVEVLGRGDPNQLLDTADAAELLGMSEAAVRQAARRGTLPAEYRGRRLRFRRGDLLPRVRDHARTRRS